MRKLIGIVMLMFLIGCTPWDSFLAEDEFILKDPHFIAYQKKVENLEWEYLHKKITYAEFREQRRELEEDYEAQVQHRELILRGEKN